MNTNISILLLQIAVDEAKKLNIETIINKNILLQSYLENINICEDGLSVLSAYYQACCVCRGELVLREQHEKFRCKITFTCEVIWTVRKKYNVYKLHG